jgi:hypothetical protein
MSSYSSDLKLELMVTGQNAGTWGDKTNTNLNLVQQSVAGYQAIDVAGADVTLAMTNATISNARNMTLEFTGTLAANRTVNFPASIEKVFNVIDSTNHAGYTLTFKVTSAAGFLLCEGNSYFCHSNGTNMIKDLEFRKWRAITASETIQAGAQLLVNTNGGAVTVTLPASPSTGDEVAFIDQGYDFNTNALTVGRNSSNIANAAADLVVNTQGAGFCLVFSGDATTGWTYKEK